ncbi:MAG TPA: hydroxymethylbilane synthase [Actinomycetota bacterium]|nr:hydroxymethylbilane synthase [Actinomycetota bacterium]
MTTPDRLTLATRGSRLARVQTDIVADLLRREHPGIEIEVLIVTATGDRDTRPFAQIGAKGIFTSEVERAVIEGRADAAVHSAKDLTAELGPGCGIAAVPSRASAHDVVIGGEGTSGEDRLLGLPRGARVGTSSMRRRALLGELRPDLQAVEFRGNLDTRVAKVERREVDAAIVAAAGLERLGATIDVGALDAERWVPAPNQGILAIEVLSERGDIVELLRPMNDDAAWSEKLCERAFSARLEGGCSVPLGCLARFNDGRLVATGFLGSPDGSMTLRDRVSGPHHQATVLGEQLADALLEAGGREILDSLERSTVPEVVEP